MACDFPKQEWTIETRIDDHPEPNKALLLFCLSVENGIINGEVSDLTTGVPVPLSLVTGTSQPLPELDPENALTVMTLIFTWGTPRVLLSGITSLRSGINRFRGGFAAFPRLAVDEAPNPDGGRPEGGPDEGDVGTGTGTQT